MAKYLLDDGTFTVRAVTRNATSASAKGNVCHYFDKDPELINCTALKDRGAEIVEADLSKPGTLAAALAGAYGVSAVTDCTYCVERDIDIDLRVYQCLHFYQLSSLILRRHSTLRLSKARR